MTKVFPKLFLILSLSISALCILYSCGTGDISRQYTKAQAVRLLTASSEKSWNISSRIVNGATETIDACELNNTLVFQVSSTDSTLMRMGENPGCDLSDMEPDVLLTATWSLTEGFESISTDTLLLSSTSGTTLNPYIISFLAARNLRVSFVDDNGDAVIENYTF